MAIMFVLMALRFAGRNRIKAHDRQWLSQWRKVINNNEEGLPAAGKYNGGQKLYSGLVVSMLMLLLSGVGDLARVLQRLFAIGVIRLASVLHALFAFVLIASIVVHVYAAIWVKGSVGAMTSGKVSWAWHVSTTNCGMTRCVKRALSHTVQCRRLSL